MKRIGLLYLDFMNILKPSSNSKAKARNRLNNSILNSRVDIPPQVLEIMRGDVFSTISKYIDAEADLFEMKWNRKGGKEGSSCEDVQYIEFVARIPLGKK